MRKQLKIKKISEDDWERALPLFDSFKVKSIKILHSVLVDGVDVQAIAKEYDLTTQNIYQLLKRATNLLTANNQYVYVNVNVWLPENEARMVFEMAKKYAINSSLRNLSENLIKSYEVDNTDYRFPKYICNFDKSDE